MRANLVFEGVLVERRRAEKCVVLPLSGMSGLQRSIVLSVLAQLGQDRLGVGLEPKTQLGLPGLEKSEKPLGPGKVGAFWPLAVISIAVVPPQVLPPP